MACNLERLERLHAAATPGPWVDKGIGSIYSPAHRKTIAECMPPICRGLKNIQQHGINAAYIIEACNSAPELIAENRALQERVRELEEHKKLLAGYAESAHTCSQCPAKHFNLCPPNEEDRARFSRPCINALIQWAELVTKQDAERTEKFPWEVDE